MLTYDEPLNLLDRRSQNVIVGEDFSGHDFSNTRMVDTTYVKCDMTGVKLPTLLSNLVNVHFINCKFSLMEEFYYIAYIKELYDAGYRLNKPLDTCFDNRDDLKYGHMTFSSDDLLQQVHLEDLVVTAHNAKQPYYRGFKVLMNEDGKYVMATLLINKNTPSILYFGSKCRAERVIVHSIKDFYGVECNAAYSCYYEQSSTKYTVGSEVVAENWDPDVVKECAGGIHFFLTDREAWRYCLQ